MNINLEHAIAILAIVGAAAGGVWGVIKSLLARDRKVIEDQQKTMWEQIEKLRSELLEARFEQERLKERMALSPDWEGRITQMEERLEKRFDDLLVQFRDFYQQAFKTFQQRQG